jgi:hypothetical protein
MPRPVRVIALLSALALIMLVPSASTAGVPPSGNRVLMQAAFAPWDTTDIIGWGKADIRQPVSWADPPGTYSFDAANGTRFRNLIERVDFWPWWDEQGNRANWAFVWGYNCPFTVDGPPACTDVNWAFVDYADPALRDFSIACWFDGGVRPPGDTWEDICDASIAHQDWTQVVSGSLVVLMSE